MVTHIQLGNFFQSGGRTVLGGVGGSGIDTEALVKALTDAKRLPATRLEDKIKLNDSRSKALADLQALLSKLKDAASFLRNPPGVGNDADNAFAFTKTTILSNTSVDGNSYLSVSSTPGTTLQNYVISDITSLARAKVQSTGDITIATADAAAVSSTPVGGQFKAGTFTLKGQQITFASGDSLNTVAAKLNAVSSQTGIRANIIQVSTGTYQLSFTATATGTTADFDFNNVDVPGTLVDPDGVFSGITTKQTATNAEFKLNGVSIVRQSNTASDVVSGVTFTLLQTTPDEDTELTIGIKPDTQTAKNGILNFISAYNDLKVFAAKQMELGPDGTFTEDAVLSGSSSLRSTASTITSQLASLVSGITGGNPSRLSDLGITAAELPASKDNPQVRNILNVDEAKLDAALEGNFTALRKVFEFTFTTSNPNIRIFQRSNALNTSGFTLDVNPFATQTTGIINVADADTAITSATPQEGFFKTGTVTINGQPIVFADGDSLNMIRDKFNAVSASSGMTAEVVSVAAGQYRLKFTSTPVPAGNNNFNLMSNAIDPSSVFQFMQVESVSTFKATYDNGSGPVTIDVDGTPLRDVNGNLTGVSLRGKAGTVLDGLVMVYSSLAASSSTIGTTQGLTDKVFNTLDGVLKLDTGSLAVEINSIKTADAKLNDDIARIDAQVETYRQQLLDKFTALEQAVSRVNTLLDSIDANNQARNNG